jgi:hypothetical protein
MDAAGAAVVCTWLQEAWPTSHALDRLVQSLFKYLEKADDITPGHDNAFWMTLAQDEASWSSLEGL